MQRRWCRYRVSRLPALQHIKDFIAWKATEAVLLLEELVCSATGMSANSVRASVSAIGNMHGALVAHVA
jgi:hypothetical protein